MKQLKIVISGGGTGGHIFPAIAIADAIRRKVPSCNILFIGAKGRMEMQKVPQAGYEIKGLWISGFQRSFSIRNLVFPLKLISSLLDSWFILRQFKPDAVIGVGGYASGPALRAAIWHKIPTIIQEQNSFPGITNRLLGKKVDRVCVAYERMSEWFPQQKTVLTGNPLRRSAIGIEGKRTEAIDFFGLNPQKPVVLLIGGSQGARSLNQAIETNLKDLVSADVQLIWQTGESFFHRAVNQVEKQRFQHLIKPLVFIQRMDLAYACADLIVSRAGAMAISEIAAVGKPAVFVPLPTAAENHQMKNALRLVEAGAADMVDNHRVTESLVPEVIRMLNDAEKLAQMRERIVDFALTDADEKIAEVVLNLIGYEH